VPHTDGQFPAGDTINICHDVVWDDTGSITNEGTVVIMPCGGSTSASLLVPDGVNIENKGGTWNIIDAALIQYRFVGGGDTGTSQAGSFKNIGGTVFVSGSVVEIAQDWTNESGATRTFVDSTHDLTETLPAGWALDSIACEDQDGFSRGTVSLGTQSVADIDVFTDKANADGTAQPGELIAYTFTVTNTGNVALTNITLDDLVPGVMVFGGPIPSLDPGQSDNSTITASYAVTQNDIDGGSFANLATACGTYFDGEVCDDDPEDVPMPTPPIGVPVNSAWVLLLIIFSIMAMGWYFRPPHPGRF
jgi:uncharacterized repeat protein (TIGR01451 family)